MWSYHRVMCPKDADGITNSADPDRTVPSGEVWSRCILFAQTGLSNNLRSFEPPQKWHVRPAKTHFNLGIQPSLIRVFAVCMKTLIRLGGCPGWSEPSVGAHSFYWFCHETAHFSNSESERVAIQGESRQIYYVLMSFDCSSTILLHSWQNLFAIYFLYH